MNENPYSSPLTKSDGAGRMSLRLWLVVLGGWTSVFLVMVCGASLGLAIVEAIEPPSAPRWFMVASFFIILGLPIAAGKATAVLYKRLYVRLASRAIDAERR